MIIKEARAKQYYWEAILDGTRQYEIQYENMDKVLEDGVKIIDTDTGAEVLSVDFELMGTEISSNFKGRNKDQWAQDNLCPAAYSDFKALRLSPGTRKLPFRVYRIKKFTTLEQST